MKLHLLRGVIAGLLSGIMGIVYLEIYQNIYFVDYSLIINWAAILGSSMIGCILMASGYYVLPKLQGVLNVLYIILSFASIIPPILMSLPLEVEFPELFPGLVVPMHFFPALVFLGANPFFNKNA